MTTMDSRDAWGAARPRATSYLASARGVKAHYTGGRVDPATLTDHARCRAAIRGIQKGHVNGNGWSDIGYSMWVCAHTFGVGRGPHVLPAANGPGLNAGHYAILFLVGTSGVVEPTDNMLRNFHAARTYLRERGAAGAEIKGHRDGYSTDCPGGPIYRWVRAGAPKPGTSPDPEPPAPRPKPTPERDEDEMEYAAFGHSGAGPVTVPRGTWWNIPWDTEYGDPTNVHTGTGTSILRGDPCVYAGVEYTATLAGLPAGTEVRTRLAEYRYDSTQTPPADVLEEAGLEGSTVLGSELAVHHVGSGKLQENRKLRCQIFVPAGPETVTLAKANVHAPFAR
ncbi:hypothetical protein [Spongiactinospora sp. TRM90649]|uniref:hypothetical protein n=1 Tax=Spongiactinospora sp. TRM90649 TaxID=3031114 RepID=UPI0023F6382F|nr:hypothetical protein [Spongiactinospora sp. TRM90649]MDF5758630.1 hypothetical protein [Spongiactinospora sp. TRM90649]